ncbi:N-acetylmuramoyl-L-alanine amidase [Bacillus cytotoxicus]|uniref:N-acetylmuramoyl-L-alanine amidase n=1 Tax=Bacillus cereus group sp. BfR-BA-01492 TaxID=2920361 RepID=UPI001F57210E|nr:N-acetylmuramoyl-L-alanine amidase [Bacillus cereus group sp. BfR-BA-01492]EMA6343065.1 N-acetylmuramoyl-L-alanine amidase [Bacillus cytotoxicus]
MPIAAISAGHNSIVPGASSSYGREELIARDFVQRVGHYFRQAGWSVVDCTDNVGTTQTAVWTNCANNHLRVKSAFDATFHLNSFNGSASGTEVLYHPSYGNLAKCEQLGRVVANAFGTNWRGVKSRPDLGWLNKTKTDYYFELLFIDNESDMKKYNQNADKAARALVSAITGVDLAPVNKYVVTGGLGVNAILEVSKYFLDHNWWAKVEFPGEGNNPFAVTGGLSEESLAKFEAWLKARGWYYEVRQ